MHDPFKHYIDQFQLIAQMNNLDWVTPFAGGDSKGWNLTKIMDGMPPARHLMHLGPDPLTLALINQRIECSGSWPKEIHTGWQDLIKAATCEQLFLKCNTPSSISNNVIRPLRVLATCSGKLPPWDLTLNTVLQTLSVSRDLQPSGKLADLIIGVVRTIIDSNHISKLCPLYPLLNSKRLGPSGPSLTRPRNILDGLQERLDSEKLPSKRAFWELVRIVFTEKPLTLTDALRFAAIKVMITCGIRVGEATLLPIDWRRQRDYYDFQGRPAGDSFGYSTAISMRYFAEKQSGPKSVSRSLFDATQYVPKMFEEILQKALDEVAETTSPLRQTLKLQFDTGRLLPQFGEDDLVPIREIYPYISGNPFWLKLPPREIADFKFRYSEAFSPAVLEELNQHQLSRYASGHRAINHSTYTFFNRIKNKGELVFRGADGSVNREGNIAFDKAHFRICELEKALPEIMPTKLPDTQAYTSSSGLAKPWEFLFLLPKRSVAEERNGGITDVCRSFSVGVPGTSLLSTCLGEQAHSESLFSRYGSTEEDRTSILTSHAFRHLQNTELFRLGIADTIITKRFNRRSVAQSHVYDHRSLAEELDEMELPPGVELTLGEKGATVARLILAGKASGPLVEKFKAIQVDQGDEQAFEFLKVEADGFHATPYGHCVNSFTVDPCPKNLECFAGCRHLTATNLPENRRHLEYLETRLEAAVIEASARPPSSIGRDNQIAHASSRLQGVRTLLASAEGEKPFPDGPDLSQVRHQIPLSVLDE